MLDVREGLLGPVLILDVPTDGVLMPWGLADELAAKIRKIGEAMGATDHPGKFSITIGQRAGHVLLLLETVVPYVEIPAGAALAVWRALKTSARHAERYCSMKRLEEERALLVQSGAPTVISQAVVGVPTIEHAP